MRTCLAASLLASFFLLNNHASKLAAKRIASSTILPRRMLNFAQGNSSR